MRCVVGWSNYRNQTTQGNRANVRGDYRTRHRKAIFVEKLKLPFPEFGKR